jgi:hypothetical protein
MADDDVSSAHISEHEGCHLTSMRPFLNLGGAILAGNMNIRPFESISDRFNGCKDRRNYNLTVICVGNKWFQSKRSVNCVT